MSSDSEDAVGPESKGKSSPRGKKPSGAAGGGGGGTQRKGAAAAKARPQEVVDIDSEDNGGSGGGVEDEGDGSEYEESLGSVAKKKSGGGKGKSHSDSAKGGGRAKGGGGGGTKGKGTKKPTAAAAAAAAAAPASGRKKRASSRPPPSYGGDSSSGSDDEDLGGDDDSETAAATTPSSSSKPKKKSPAAGAGAGAGAAAAEEENGKQPGGGARGKGKGKAKATGGGVLSSAKPAKLADDVEVVLRRLRKLRGQMGRGGGGSADGDADRKKQPTLLELGLSGDVTEVREMGAAGVMDEIERIAVETALSIMEGNGFGFRVPTRSSGNQKYVEELDRIVLGDKVSSRNFVSTAMARKTAITTRVVQLVHQVLGKGIHITKRDMFYTDVKLFKEQSESDNVLDDVACMVGCTRSCLNVVASDKGLVVGRVTFMEDGDLIDCTRMGVGGKAIPPYIDKITNIRSDADFILLVEKEAAYMRMAEDRFYQKYPCIVITAKGQPDVATRLFLKRLKRELNIPVMGLVDSDPYGLKILSVYMSGSKNMSYDSASLTTPDIKWLGVRPSDLDRYNIPEQCRLDMTEHDIKTGKELLQEDFIKKNEPWCRELELMIKSKKKAEIQSLSAFGFQYLTQNYLPQKLQNGDWV
ncbi:DNA topoisomerase VI subunit A [Ectocarpus siliculosus]|uniref:DNA topoisomerase (ATP-hydrolyzing) n=1 Tax=Ectocarpus siliculosus TaxID=2880 RepID=D7FY71_ECTSI|nr:DNA topoisomerase VI subunit A [Ectocarpus siliculosus]|eukprot:CBJ26510.1 DNA topoisomerase VI subunit A [Ectocarpus siliculosus]